MHDGENAQKNCPQQSKALDYVSTGLHVLSLRVESILLPTHSQNDTSILYI